MKSGDHWVIDIGNMRQNEETLIVQLAVVENDKSNLESKTLELLYGMSTVAFLKFDILSERSSS